MPKLAVYTIMYTIALSIIFIGGRFGILNKYIAGIIGIILDGPVMGVSAYITAGLGAVYLEYQELSSDPNYAYTSDKQMILRRFWPAPAVNISAVIFTRCCLYGVGGLIAWKVPAAPFQVPWYISLVLLGGLAIYNKIEIHDNDGNSSTQPFQELIIVAAVGLVISLLNKGLHQFTGGDFNPAVAVILALSVASLVPGAAQDTTPWRNEYAREEDQDAMEFDFANLFTWSIPMFISWVCPGLSIATCNRCLGQYTSQVTNNHQEALMEGWSYGAITMWGTMTGKTMLGELLQNWLTTMPSDLNDPLCGFAIVFILGLAAPTLNTLTLPDKVNQMNHTTQTTLKLCVAITLLIQSFILLGPLTIVFCIVGLFISYLLPNYSLRPLLLLFLAA